MQYRLGHISVIPMNSWLLITGKLLFGDRLSQNEIIDEKISMDTSKRTEDDDNKLRC